MSRKLLNLCMTALMCAVSTAAWALSEVGGVYQIGTADDLIAFAELVNAGNPYLNAVLTADIDKGIDDTMIGKDGVDYQGIFDGQGHSITINMFSGSTDGTAVFRNIGAKGIVQNLKVQGTITSSVKNAAGIAAWSRGTARNCYVDVEVISSRADDGTYGGIFGQTYQGTMIVNCLAKFKITGAQVYNCGGIVGWCSERTNIINCLVINDGSDFKIDNGSGTIARNEGQFTTVNLEEYIGNEYDKRPGGASTNNYATNAWGNTKCVTVVPYDDLADGRICYQLNNDQSVIAWKQEIGKDPFPVPAIFGGKQVYASGPTACDGKSEDELTFSNSGTASADAHEFDKFGICSVCGCYNINGLQRDPADGSYLVASAEDIDLCEGLNRLQNGGWFDIKMTDDIEYIAEPGRFIFNNGNWFDGNFYGQGHTLTIEMTDMVDNNASLFPNFSGTIRDLVMHGSITTSGQFAGSISGETRRGTMKAINVFSDIEINANRSGDNTTGGFFGVTRETTRVDNCIYAGDINGIEGTECIAGFVGWGGAQTYFTNCAFIGNLNNAGGDSKTISRNPNNVTSNNVYSLNDYGFGDEGKWTLFENYDGIESGELAYYLNGKAGGVDRFYQKIGEDLYPLPIKKDGALVYASASSYRCDGQPEGNTVYTNSDPGTPVLPAHEYDEGFCSVCGLIQEDFLTPVDGWYEISNGAELLWWATHAALGELDANARLTDDIDMDGYSERWPDVGTRERPFHGNFDGQFHTISNFDIDKPNSDGVGLIGVMSSLPSSGFGGLSDTDARAAEGVTIKNVVLDESCSISGHGYIGLVGMTAPWAGHVNIKGVMMCGDVKANGGPNASGVFGCVMNSACHVTIDNCGMVGNVYGTTENGSFSGWLGDYAEVTNCFAVGSVEGIQDDAHYFARYGKATFTNCYARYGTQVPTVTEEDFESGALAWRANGEQFRTGYWFQNIGVDMYPFPDPSHGVVIFAAEQYFGVSGDEELDNVVGIIKSYEEEAVEDVLATQSLLDEYTPLVASIEEASTILELADVLDAVYAKKAEVTSNAATYQAYIDKCESILAYINETTAEGAKLDALKAYLTESEEPSEDNPLGTYAYVIDNHTATAEEIQAEIERLDAWLQEAVSEGYVAGSDISNLLVNGDFSEGSSKGWTVGYGSVGGSGTVQSNDPENDKYIGVEAWATTVDLSQTLEGMKPGYYLVGTHAAFRANDNRYGYNYGAGLYANGTFNFFPTVIEDYVPVDEAVDRVNCYLSGNDAIDLKIYDDYFSKNDDEAEVAGANLLGYVVHGFRGMAAAAHANRYAVYTLGKVGEDGKLTVGIKNPGSSYGNDWTGWSAFNLTYLGEEPSSDYLGQIVDNMRNRAQTILENYEPDVDEVGLAPNYPNKLKEQLQAAYNNASSDETSINTLSDLFQQIYEGKQAYLAMYNGAELVDNVLGGSNLPLVEYDEELDEWYENGEMLFSDDEVMNLEDISMDIYDQYSEGSYTTEQAQQAAATVQSLTIDQDEEGAYLIGTPKQLAIFRSIVSDQNNTVTGKLVADIDMKGIGMLPMNSDGYPFKGTFDGQTYALSNVTILDAGERTSLFNKIEGGTVKNLRLSGDYYSASKFMAGITGEANNVTLQNSEIAVKFHSTIAGDGTHGGAFGRNAGSDNTVVENCLFNCQFLGEETNSCGGVCGWASNKLTVRNTLILSQGATISTEGCNTVSRNEANCTVDNVFYVETLGSANGTLTTAEQLASGETTYKLNGSKSDNPAWFQTIGSDATPHLFDGAIVYYYGGQYINEEPNPQLNAFAYNLEASLAGEKVTVEYSLNAEAEAVNVNFFDGDALVYAADADENGLTIGKHSVTVDASNLGADPTALNYEVVVKGKGSLEILKIGESISVGSPYGLAINNNPASKNFGQILFTETRPLENLAGLISVDTPGALIALGADFKYQGGYYGGLGIAGEKPLVLPGNNQLDLKDLRFSADGRLFVGRASGLTGSSVYEINPDNLNEAWTPVFAGGELDEATGITYVGDDEQNRMAVGLATEGEGDDLKLYVLGTQLSNGETNTTDYNCSVYNLGTAKQWTAAPSASIEGLNGVYAATPTHIGIQSDGQGGLWFIQYVGTRSAETPAIKHFNAEGEEDFSDDATGTHSGKIAVSADGQYLAIPMGENKVVIYETNYVPMANGKIFLNPVYNIATAENNITGLAFDYANNLYAASSGSHTLSRYVLPSQTENYSRTPGNGIKLGATGDVNRDGTVDIADAVTVLNIMAEGSDEPIADVNKDGKVDIADFVSVLNIMAQQ